LSSITLNDGSQLKVSGLFIAIGHEASLDFLNFNVELDKNGFIMVDKYMKTSVDGVYACGDITSKHFKQIISACSDGAIAGNSCVGGVVYDS